MESNELQIAIERLAAARKWQGEGKASVDKLRAEFDIEHATELEQLAGAKDSVAEFESTVRLLALAEYDNTGNKSPHTSVFIQINKMLNYDEDDAFFWALENDMTILKFNKSAFNQAYKREEKNAKDAGVDFDGLGISVDVVDQPIAKIAGNLSAYIQDGE